jgi:hypothetical protein
LGRHFNLNTRRDYVVDKVRGREVLARHLSPVRMTPMTDEVGRRYYRAVTSFSLTILLGNNTTPPGEPSGVVVFHGSGGRIAQLSTVRF